MEEVVEEAIKEYNKYRRSVAEAKKLKVDDGGLLVEISGTLCHTCGLLDYLEDLVYEVERVTSEYGASLRDYEQVADDKYVVRYRIEKRRD